LSRGWRSRRRLLLWSSSRRWSWRPRRRRR
jgi:hypothetical protein